MSECSEDGASRDGAGRGQVHGASETSGLRVMAVASSGGHWVQLRKLTRMLKGHDIAYVSVNDGYRQEVAGSRFYVVDDANMWGKLRLLKLAFQVLIVVLKERPHVVISTGAAPGFFALLWAKLLLKSGTVWIDSIANSDQLSISGQRVGMVADLWLTQWEHLSSDGGPHYAGTILVI